MVKVTHYNGGGVDFTKILINAAAIFGIGMLWFDFNKNVFLTVKRLYYEPYTWPNSEKE